MSIHRLRGGVRSLRHRLLATMAAVAATTTVAIAYETYRQGVTATTLPTLLLFYGGSAVIITAFAVWTAAELDLPSLLVLSRLPWPERMARWVVLGPALGLVLAAASVWLTGETDSPLRPWFWQRIQTSGGAALLSARAALLEETFFRLFMIPFLVSVASRARPARRRLKLADGSAQVVEDPPPEHRLMLLLAVVASSAMFGLAHFYNPMGAALLAPALAIAYLWGGWESAVTAHFVANMVLFSYYY